MAEMRLIDADAYEYPGDLIHMPTIDAVPVVHGRWVRAHGMMPPEYHHRKQCSMCGGWALQDFIGRECLSPYCPNCGIPMDVQDENAPTKSDRGCSTCANDGYDMPQCRECTEHPGYPWYKRKDGGAE